MKTKLFKNLAGGAVAAIFFLAGGTGFIANAQDQPPPPPATGNPMPDNATALPPGVDASSPLAEVIRLAQAGVSETVIMSYVNNSTSPFNLNSDQIIYLKDIGVPDNIVQTMIQRDQTLQQQGYQTPAPAPAPAVVNTTYVSAPPVVTVDYFYSTLSPYGSWVYIEGYGRCWRPAVVAYNAGWSPYCDHGHWVWTDAGWYWMSDYSWGWAPFHYGRWFRDVRLGWCWYPDTVWGPSWVTWRYSDDYCGWAPLPPRCVYREGVGFFYNGVSVGINFDFGLSVSCFNFVPTRNFCDPRPWHYRVAPAQVTQVFNHTTIINNFNEDREHRGFVNRGIDPDRITRVTHREIRPITIHDSTGRIPRGEQLDRDGRTLMVNRPHFSDNPSRFQNRGDAPRVSQPSPGMGSPSQPPRNGNNNNNSPAPGHNQPVTPPPVVGSPYQPPHNGNGNNNSQSPRHNQPTQPTPAPGQPQNPPFASPGSPGHNQMMPPSSPSPGNRYAPITPVQPQAPNNNLNNSTDNRRYPSPRMQQPEQQNPRVNPGNPGGRVGTPVTPPAPVNPPQANHYSPPPAQPPQRNYGAPVTPPAQPAPPPPRNYTPPRNDSPPGESRPNYSQPPAQGNQSHSASAPSSPPSQSQGSQGRGNGRGRNQNGQ